MIDGAGIRRRRGFVHRGDHWVSIEQAGAWIERDRREIWERVQVGGLPAMRLGSGEMVIPVAMLGAINRRVSEHD